MPHRGKRPAGAPAGRPGGGMEAARAREAESVAAVVYPAHAARRPIIAHIPHSSREIPAHVRRGLRIDDATLAAELLRLTDHHADRLFAWAGGLGATRFVARYSRLVVDPERFADDESEPMARVGQGAVYTRTTEGRLLRRLGAGDRDALVERYYAPYHRALADLVSDDLARTGECLVLDCHSFGSRLLPSEPDRSPDRPDICIGTDRFHTPPELAERLRGAMAAEGFAVELDRPFAGSLVPLRYYGVDGRVRSVMVEVRRGLYCDEATAEPLPCFEDVAGRIGRAVAGALG